VLVWLNGRLVPARAARVSALDRGFLHGDGLYDTWRTYGGVSFALAAHLRRLAAGARALGLPSPGKAATWETRTRLLVTRNRLPDAAVRLTLTRGEAGDGLLPARRAQPTLLLSARPLPPDLDRLRRHGATAILLPFPRDAGAPWGGYKLVGHASAVAGRLLAARRRATEGLYVTRNGSVTEGTSTNLFLVRGDRLVTPPPSVGLLAGVTRELVVRLARRAGLRVREEEVTRGDLRRAHEIFLTASTIEILPLVRIDGHLVGSGRPGPVTGLLRTRYAAHVAGALRLRRTTAASR